jgi:hypothetical protein
MDGVLEFVRHSTFAVSVKAAILKADFREYLPLACV